MAGLFALTYDDGPGPSTEALLDVLEAAGAKATFFLLGRNLCEAPWAGGDVARARALVVRMLRAGHRVGNHTMTHRFPIEAGELVAELAAMDGALADVAREAGVTLDGVPFRLPYGVRLEAGAMDPRLAVAAGQGRAHVHWSADFEDWTLAAGDGARLAGEMIAHLRACAAAGRDAVLDLHDSGTGGRWGYARPATVEATALLLAEARSAGWGWFLAPRAGG